MGYTKLPELKLSPKNIISLDVEQDDKGDAYIFCVTGRTGYGKKNISRVFHDAKACATFLFKRKWRRTILTGNNLLFDLNHLTLSGCFDWEILSTGGAFITASPPKREVTPRYERECLSIIDVNNFYPHQTLLSMVQDKSGEFLPEYVTYCKDHNADPYIDKHILGVDGNKEEMTKACLSHCWAAVFALGSMQRQIQHLGSNLEITPALTAQKLHKRKYLSKNCQIYTNYDEITDKDKLFMNEAYYGGRTEVFKEGRTYNVSGIDINSSYPFVMRNKPFPDMLSYKESHKVSLDSFMELLKNYEGLASITIESPDLKIPFLPLADNGKLIFPVGSWEGTYTFPEIRFALKLGYKIINVFRVGTCRQTKDPLFKDYVDNLYPLKEDSRYKAGVKLMLNSLYGKFGQKANESTGWQIIPDSELDQLEPDDLSLKNCKVALNGLLLKHIQETPIEERGFTQNSYPLVAAYVTSYARINLYKAMQAIGFNHVYYCDTDSLYGDTNAINKAIIEGKINIDPLKLGCWDLEHDNIIMEVRGLKYYRLFEDVGWKYTIKGVPKDSQSEFWEYKKCMVKRVWKRPSAIRFKKKLNAFYEHPLTEQSPTPKRTFKSNGFSIPLYRQSIFT